MVLFTFQSESPNTCVLGTYLRDRSTDPHRSLPTPPQTREATEGHGARFVTRPCQTPNDQPQVSCNSKALSHSLNPQTPIFWDFKQNLREVTPPWDTRKP